MFIDVIQSVINAIVAGVPRRKPAEAQWEHVQIIAHRGAHDHRQQIWENTHQAFARAQEYGCWGIEFDVRSTADDVLIVHHDATLERLWGSTARIETLTFEKLRRLAPQVPSLQEMVQRYGGRMHFFIELKAPFKNAAALQTVLKTLSGIDDYHLISLDEKILAELSGFPAQALLLVPEALNVQRYCELSLTTPYGGVLGHYLLLNLQKVQRLRQARQQVGVGLVNSQSGLYREVSRGIKWIFTDNVANLMKKT